MEGAKGQGSPDHIEMSGRRVSAIITYGVRENGALTLSRHIVFPALRRTIPNDTHASLSYVFGEDAAPRVFLAGKLVTNEVVTQVHHLGLMTIESTVGKPGEIGMTRVVFPSTDKPLVLERYIFSNHSEKETTIEVEDTGERRSCVLIRRKVSTANT